CIPERTSEWRGYARLHDSVNFALADSTDRVQRELTKKYGWWLGLLDGLLGNLDELVTTFAFQSARGGAFLAALALAQARNSGLDELIELVTRRIESECEITANAFLGPKALERRLAVLRSIEASQASEAVRAESEKVASRRSEAYRLM